MLGSLKEMLESHAGTVPYGVMDVHASVPHLVWIRWMNPGTMCLGPEPGPCALVQSRSHAVPGLLHASLGQPFCDKDTGGPLGAGAHMAYNNTMSPALALEDSTAETWFALGDGKPSTPPLTPLSSAAKLKNVQ